MCLLETHWERQVKVLRTDAVSGLRARKGGLCRFLFDSRGIMAEIVLSTEY